MTDFNALQTELKTKGTEIIYEVKHNDNVVVFYYENVNETKQVMDAIVESYLANYTITSTLENNAYKGDATNQTI